MTADREAAIRGRLSDSLSPLFGADDVSWLLAQLDAAREQIDFYSTAALVEREAARAARAEMKRIIKEDGVVVSRQAKELAAAQERGRAILLAWRRDLMESGFSDGEVIARFSQALATTEGQT